jgi:PAS domain S-box-containing protein
MELEALKRYSSEYNILFVEDSLTVRKVVQKMLEKIFASVSVAKDGEEGWQQYVDYYNANEKTFDIVISDLEMPNMDGEALSQKILGFNCNQDVIVISGINDFSRVVDLINLGVKKFVAKPVEAEQLHEVLYQVVMKIRKQRLQEDEQAELAEYNEILKEREERHLQDLEAANKSLSDLAEALDQSALVAKTDLDGLITYVNDRFCKVSGYDRDELIGQNHNLLNSGKMSTSFFMRLWNTITANKNYSGLFINRAKNGKIFYIDSFIKPLVDGDGEIKEFIAVSHDMTRLMESLQNEQDARKAKDEFFVNISHEMRTPLNAVLGFSTLLKKRLKDDEKAVNMMEIIENSAKELNDLIESVLDVRKLKENRLKLVDTEFIPAKELQRCFDKYSEKASRKKSQTFVADVDAEMPEKLFGDHRRLIQALSALMDNAIKFTPDEGRIEVHAFYEPSEEKLICQVKDTGIGISEENQKRIFDIQQADGSLNRSHEGAGLGLSIATEITKLMQGGITVSSEEGQGATFMLVAKIPRTAG